MNEFEQQGQSIIMPGKDIVASSAQELRRRLWALIDEGIHGIVVDLNGVRMIDSIGLGVLISTHNALKKKGGKLSVVNATRDICSLFRAMRLDQHFDVKMVA